MYKKSPKNPGISLIMALSTSMFVLTLTMAITLGLKKSMEKTSNVQRSLQLFYAAEAGMDAAFYHHNARGPGVVFTSDNLSEQILKLDNVGAQTYWKINGGASSGTYYGVFTEGQSQVFSFTKHTSTDPSQTPANTDASSPDFKITFYSEFDSNFPQSLQDKYGVIKLDNMGAFSLGNTDTSTSEVVIGWKVLKKPVTGPTLLWSPKTDETSISDCSNTSLNSPLFICEDYIIGSSVRSPIRSSDGGNGRVTGGPTITFDSLDNFMNDSSAAYSVAMTPLLKFEGELADGTKSKFAGIPYSLEDTDGNGLMTLPVYTVESVVTLGNFSQRIYRTIPERNTVGGFDAVIFN